MMNVKEKVKNAIVTVKRKAVPVAVSVASALSTVCVTAFAADGSSSTSSMYSTIADGFSSGISDVASGVGTVLSAVIPFGVGIIGVMSCIGVAKRIFNQIDSLICLRIRT